MEVKEKICVKHVMIDKVCDAKCAESNSSGCAVDIGLSKQTLQYNTIQ